MLDKLLQYHYIILWRLFTGNKVFIYSSARLAEGHSSVTVGGKLHKASIIVVLSVGYVKCR